MSKKQDQTTTTTTTTTPADDAHALAVASPAMGLRPIDDDAIAGFDADGFEAGAKFVTLTAGTIVVGELTGRGGVDITDKRTGEMKRVTTWILRIGGVDGSIEFLSAHELDRQLAPIWARVEAGRRHEVKIARGHDERVGGVVVSRYRTAARAMVVRP